MKLLNHTKHFALLLLLTTAVPYFLSAQLNNNGAAIVMNPGTNLILDNISFRNDGIFNQTAGVVTFLGNTNASVSGTIVPSFYSVRVSKPGSVLELQTIISIKGFLECNNGLLNLNGNNILLSPSALLIEDEANHIYGTTGYIEISQVLDQPFSVDPGSMGITITSSQNLGFVTIRRGHRSQTNGAGAGNSILRYYDIIPANNTNLDAKLNFRYFDGETNGLDENQLTIWKSTNNINWTNLGRTANNTVNNYVELSGISNLARFTLSSIGNILPVTWGSFNTQCASGKAIITWKTVQEQNSALFYIRRSINGQNWTTIGTVPAAGNSNSPRTYSFTDQQPSDANYYQIQEQDINGHLHLSPVLLLRCAGNGDLLTVFPNPAKSNCWISLQSNTNGPLTIRLYDSKGALMKQQQETIRNGTNQFELKLDGFANGLYSIVITKPDGSIKVAKVEKF